MNMAAAVHTAKAITLRGGGIAGEAQLELLREEYSRKRRVIQSRLAEFRRFYAGNCSWSWEAGRLALVPSEKSGDELLFEELAFCILTANSSFSVGMRAIGAIGELLLESDARALQERLKSIRCRFHTKRAGYIAATRRYLEAEHGFRLRRLLESLRQDRHALRDFFALNPGIRGIGYKEASHFLRNIGFRGYAILDKHILASMHEFGLMPELKRPATRAQYLGMEEMLAAFSRSAGIGFDELDLLLWSRRNGAVLK